MTDEKNTEFIPENETQNTVPINVPEDISLKEPTIFADEESDTDSYNGADASDVTEEDDALTESDIEDSLSDTDADSLDESEYENGNSESENTNKQCELNIETSEKKNVEENTRFIDSLFDFIELFIFTLATVFIITSFFFRYSVVEGDSMIGTLYDNDKLILTSFMYEPEQGDIVVVDSDVLNKFIVKRIIAVGGQTVRIEKDAIYVDGEKLNEPYVYTDDYSSPFGKYQYSVPEEGYIEIKVPKGHIYVMGDHRNISEDSRTIGTVDEDSIIGKVIFRFAPFDVFGPVE